MVTEDGGVTSFKLRSLFMQPVRMCCTDIFKHGQYSYLSNAFIQHGKFDLLVENSW